jgi:transketolase C-terminal domain/subunit
MTWQYSSLRNALGNTLVELGDKYPDVLVLNADLRNSVKTVYFMEKYPERTIEVGIAEQNMIGVAAGLAMMGYIPFTVTFARFASKRAADQISMCVDYCRNNVRIIGAYAGIFTGAQGVSQQMTDDTAAMRAMPNMTVVDTADVVEINRVLHFAAEFKGPIYIRVGRDEWPVVLDQETYKFELGQGTWLGNLHPRGIRTCEPVFWVLACSMTGPTSLEPFWKGLPLLFETRWAACWPPGVRCGKYASLAVARSATYGRRS